MKGFGLSLAIMGLFATFGSAIACEIEDWRYQDYSGHIKIEGAASCKDGRLSIRAYNGRTEEFVGATTTYIRGYTFETYITNASAPSGLSIKYSIEE
jgi:hypothetical protein